VFHILKGFVEQKPDTVEIALIVPPIAFVKIEGFVAGSQMATHFVRLGLFAKIYREELFAMMFHTPTLSVKMQQDTAWKEGREKFLIT